MDLRLKPYRVIATGVNSDNEGVGTEKRINASSAFASFVLRHVTDRTKFAND